MGANVDLLDGLSLIAVTTELLFRDDAYLKTASARVLAVDELGIELDRTIFYPLGVPVGTRVHWCAPRRTYPIADTRKGDAIDACVMCRAGMPQPELGEMLTLEIDWERRYADATAHGATLMSCVVAAPVTGGNNSPTRLVSISI